MNSGHSLKNIHDNPMIQALKNIAMKRVYYKPRELVAEAIKYFKYCNEDREWVRQQWVGKDGIEVEQKVKTPYNISGFLAYTGIPLGSWGAMKRGTYLEATEQSLNRETREMFRDIAMQIEQIIANDQINGAMTGHYNHNIVSRLQGLTDKKDITSGGESLNKVSRVAVELPEGVDMEAEIAKNSQIEDVEAEVVESDKDKAGGDAPMRVVS